MARNGIEFLEEGKSSVSLRLNSLKERDEWQRVMNAFPMSDIYYMPDYMETQEELERGRALLAVWDPPDFDGKVAYAFIKRSIEGYDDVFDITTPYGYGGPIFSGSLTDSSRAIREFRAEFSDYCRDSRIVSEFVRFHPLLGNYVGDCCGMKTAYVRDTVVVELDASRDPLVAFPSKTRNMVRKAVKRGVRVEVSSDATSLREFIRLYNETMQRRNAADYYFFSELFFKELLEKVKPRPFLLTACLGDRAIASALFLRFDQFLHYHFSGSDPDFQRFAPNDLIIYEAAVQGIRLGAKRLHLGGGYKGTEDSLFRFKASFSDVRTPFYIGRQIHDQEAYDKLCIVLGRNDEGYFPAYRKRG